jgi:hypothetical protein
MRFHGSPRHMELAGDLGVVTTLQKQLDNLLFARTEPNSLLLHPTLQSFDMYAPVRLAQGVSISHSIRVAILRQEFEVFTEQYFPQAFAVLIIVSKMHKPSHKTTNRPSPTGRKRP